MNILLVCAFGMSTSLLVNKMKNAAIDENIEVNIVAKSANEALKDLSGYDLVLLAPQVRYQERKFKKALKDTGIPISIIDIEKYGGEDGLPVLKDALNAINKGENNE